MPTAFIRAGLAAALVALWPLVLGTTMARSGIDVLALVVVVLVLAGAAQGAADRRRAAAAGSHVSLRRAFVVFAGGSAVGLLGVWSGWIAWELQGELFDGASSILLFGMALACRFRRASF